VTPLEAAHTPALDFLAHRGVLGRVRTVGAGVAPESDVAVFHMLGYELGENYVGRGVIEAIGAGVRLRTGELALRANFATADKRGNILDRRAGRDLGDDEAAGLAKAISSGVRLADPQASFVFQQTVAHRAVFVLRHATHALSAQISNTDPGYVRIKGMGAARASPESGKPERAAPLVRTPAARKAASLLNEWITKASAVLRQHEVNQRRQAQGRLPANLVLLRDAGDRRPRLPSLSQRYGRTFASIVDMPVEIGISRVTGMAWQQTERAEDYGARAARAVKLLDRYDVVYVHLKGPDEPGHDGDAPRKRKIIEEIDRRFFAPLTSALDLTHTAIAVSADHATPCALRGHSDDLVPLVIAGGRASREGCCRFTERGARRGSLGVLHGVAVLPTVLRLT
jgi:2,3-bisphosphoglycerate-independent phosphoglycerate mutase